MDWYLWIWFAVGLLLSIAGCIWMGYQNARGKATVDDFFCPTVAAWLWPLWLACAIALAPFIAFVKIGKRLGVPTSVTTKKAKDVGGGS